MQEEIKMANKQELVTDVATATGLTKKDATAAVDAVFASIQDTLAKGEKVQLIGFGNFEVRSRAARKGRNPQTGKFFVARQCAQDNRLVCVGGAGEPCTFGGSLNH
jgi:DNA-binding protein HU-beta